VTFVASFIEESSSSAQVEVEAEAILLETLFRQKSRFRFEQELQAFDNSKSHHTDLTQDRLASNYQSTADIRRRLADDAS
jgi:hypothetical protein